IPPAEFIPIAEELGIIIPIGTWVLRTACTCNKAWQKKGITPMRIAVNISSLQFKQKDFVEIVKNILAETELEPRYLELEITESAILLNIAEMIDSMKELKELGVSIAIDNFG